MHSTIAVAVFKENRTCNNQIYPGVIKRKRKVEIVNSDDRVRKYVLLAMTFILISALDYWKSEKRISL